MINDMRDIDSIRAWFFISKNFHLISSENQLDLRGYGLTTSQFDIIVNLGSRGPMNQNTLAGHLLVTKGDISTVIRRLEKKGFVVRTKPLEDRRQKLVRLTEKGRRIYEMSREEHEKKLGSLFSVLSDKERKTLVKILKKLYSHMKEKR